MSNQIPRIETQDIGVVESSDDHFSSASEGTPNPSAENLSHPEIPITRVERVDDKAHHGEVPGTAAYSLRTQDAVPDEVEIVPEGGRSRSATLSRSRASSTFGQNSRPQTPGSSPIPKLVVERVDNKPSYGEVDGTLAREMRSADAVPDEVKRVPDSSDSPDGRRSMSNDPEERQAWFRSMWDGDSRSDAPQEKDDDANVEQDDFGDDFADFADGGGDNDDDDDFGDFDDTEAPTDSGAPLQDTTHSAVPSVFSSFPSLDAATDMTNAALADSIAPYLDAIFPESPLTSHDIPAVNMASSSHFLTDRSLSLWQQLVSPPPMQPPNWTRSRIRRLFLVSLGVPVDLDEILPPSKQKRLVLPNISLASPRHSSSALERIKKSNTNDSSTSIDSKTGAPKKPLKRAGTFKGPSPPPDFDANAAALLCGTTQEAMQQYADAELRDHLSTLEALNTKASAVLEYWLQRKDDAIKEKEALEGVIENLVGFVKGRRGK